MVMAGINMVYKKAAFVMGPGFGALRLFASNTGDGTEILISATVNNSWGTEGEEEGILERKISEVGRRGIPARWEAGCGRRVGHLASRDLANAYTLSSLRLLLFRRSFKHFAHFPGHDPFDERWITTSV